MIPLHQVIFHLPWLDFYSDLMLSIFFNSSSSNRLKITFFLVFVCYIDFLALFYTYFPSLAYFIRSWDKNESFTVLDIENTYQKFRFIFWKTMWEYKVIITLYSVFVYYIRFYSTLIFNTGILAVKIELENILMSNMPRRIDGNNSFYNLSLINSLAVTFNTCTSWLYSVLNIWSNDYFAIPLIVNITKKILIYSELWSNITYQL